MGACSPYHRPLLITECVVVSPWQVWLQGAGTPPSSSNACTQGASWMGPSGPVSAGFERSGINSDAVRHQLLRREKLSTPREKARKQMDLASWLSVVHSLRSHCGTQSTVLTAVPCL
jgi:hypothetical protein